MRRRLADGTGLVSELPRFAGLDLADWAGLVVGGHEIRDSRLVDEAERLHTESRVFGGNWLRECQADLDAADREVVPGLLHNVGSTISTLATPHWCPAAETPREAVLRVRRDLDAFVARNNLERLVVVNVASTEPPAEESVLPGHWQELEPLLDDTERCPLPASSLYAIAALGGGHSYVNFTPSLGAKPKAIQQLALECGTCHMGHDGKTGETLMKSVLAPMFTARHLNVMSWVGHNIFGNLDGKVLNDPSNKRTKVESKDRLLGQILGYHPQSLVSIEYIESLGDWKTAWDHVHFRGFLGTPMVLQFVWQGCDSLLAAPLVIDLVRFTERSARGGETGLLTHLASFFKSPLGVDENDFVRQYQMLEAWSDQVSR